MKTAEEYHTEQANRLRALARLIKRRSQAQEEIEALNIEINQAETEWTKAHQTEMSPPRA